MKSFECETYNHLSWYPFSDEPLIKAKWFTPRLCDPALVLPEESPDNRWHMFAHNWLGIQHFVSDNGLDWTARKMIELRGHSPFIFHSKGVWYLLYEKHDSSPSQLDWKEFTDKSQRISSSRIEICSTEDMVIFSKPIVLLDSKNVPFANISLNKPRLSRPQLFYDEKYGYRLFLGASHLKICDSNQKATLYFALAQSDTLLGEYKIVDNKPLLEPSSEDEYRNLAVGSVRVIQATDGYVGFECAFGWDKENNKSISTLVQLESEDGIRWQKSKRKPLITLPESGWASRYITSCDIRYMENDYCYYCYFSGNSKVKFGPFTYVNESIGLLLGKDPNPRKVFR